MYVRNKKTTYFHCFALKTDNSLFCHRDIHTIHNAYCVSNAVDYAKKTMFYQRVCQLNKGSVIIDFSTEHHFTSIYRNCIFPHFLASGGQLFWTKDWNNMNKYSNSKLQILGIKRTPHCNHQSSPIWLFSHLQLFAISIRQNFFPREAITHAATVKTPTSFVLLWLTTYNVSSEKRRMFCFLIGWGNWVGLPVKNWYAVVYIATFSAKVLAFIIWRWPLVQMPQNKWNILNTFLKLMKGKSLREHSLHGKIAASVLLKLLLGYLMMPHQWRPTVHERNSIFKCKQTYNPWSLRTRKIQLHNDEIRGDILQPPHRHLTPAVVS